MGDDNPTQRDAGTPVGHVAFDESVVATIARDAALTVDGVVRVVAPLPARLKGALGGPVPGVVATLELDGRVRLAVHLVVAYGTALPVLAAAVRSRVCAKVEGVTTLGVVGVDVHVDQVTTDAG